jgi:hypothetical protein
MRRFLLCLFALVALGSNAGSVSADYIALDTLDLLLEEESLLEGLAGGQLFEVLSARDMRSPLGERNGWLIVQDVDVTSIDGSSFTLYAIDGEGDGYTLAIDVLGDGTLSVYDGELDSTEFWRPVKLSKGVVDLAGPERTSTQATDADPSATGYMTPGRLPSSSNQRQANTPRVPASTIDALMMSTKSAAVNTGAFIEEQLKRIETLNGVRDALHDELATLHNQLRDSTSTSASLAIGSRTESATSSLDGLITSSGVELPLGKIEAILAAIQQLMDLIASLVEDGASEELIEKYSNDLAELIRRLNELLKSMTNAATPDLQSGITLVENDAPPSSSLTD